MVNWTLLVCLSLCDFDMPLILLVPDTALLCDALLAESSGTTSPDDDGLALARGAGPLRLKDADGTRSFWAAERAFPKPDIATSHFVHSVALHESEVVAAMVSCH